MYKKGDFTQYVDFVKNSCEQGLCTKPEAIKAILDKAIDMLQSLPKEEELRQERKRELMSVDHECSDTVFGNDCAYCNSIREAMKDKEEEQNDLMRHFI